MLHSAAAVYFFCERVCVRVLFVRVRVCALHICIAYFQAVVQFARVFVYLFYAVFCLLFRIVHTYTHTKCCCCSFSHLVCVPSFTQLVLHAVKFPFAYFAFFCFIFIMHSFSLSAFVLSVSVSLN